MNTNSSPAATTCLLISDFNAGNLKSYLETDSGTLSPGSQALRVVMPDYGQVMQTLLDAEHECWQEQPEITVIWTRPEAVVASFTKILQAESATIGELLDEVNQFADLVIAAAERARTVVVPLWAPPTGHRGLGPIDLRPGGTRHALLQMNLRLTERLHEQPGIFVVDSDQWLARQGNPEMAHKFWYAAKTPYSTEVFRAAAADIKALVRATAGQSSKLLILDLDDTLWGGIVGDVGWENLRLGGHDPVGEAFQDFQRGVKALQNRGVVLAVVSKNDEETALTAVDKHPEMLIRRDDLAGWRINWNDKAQNIVELVDELNLGLDAVVFIDDNPAERGRVAEALPEVFVPDWPADKLLYRHALNSLNCFDPAAVSAEDAERSRAYAAERQRRQSKTAVSMDDWLESLELQVRISELADANRQRAVQLLNKTNQMNLSTRRLTEDELKSWLESGERTFHTVWVEDRFGDSGLTGLVSTEIRDGVCRIVDFVLSCRVFGRKVENVMTAIAVAEARRRGACTVEATYEATAKNRPTLDFFTASSGLDEAGPNVFTWDTGKDYPLPPYISVDGLNTENS
ncbi:MAG: HAD-IIIC family phosphatase [Gammaproteobacteria bacterium]|nr:HAD-IIIC family phosphatase [Gammaproteobacteria bacterium]